MLVIRLARTGRKNTATFRLVLQEKTQAPKSKSQEVLGSYHPHLKTREEQVQLKVDRITYWLSQGAQPSATVHNMLVEFGVIEGSKRKVVAAAKKVEEAPVEKAEDVPAEESTEAPKEEVKEEAAS